MLSQFIGGGGNLANDGAEWISIFVGFHIPIYVSWIEIALYTWDLGGGRQGIYPVYGLISFSLDIIYGVFLNFTELAVIGEDGVQLVVIFVGVDEDEGWSFVSTSDGYAFSVFHSFSCLSKFLIHKAMVVVGVPLG